ncbi:MAG: tRNA guanosine(15) transglycosylase TgtA [Candidatus Heimdallarchaeota archaeon]|nr:tRNA guanosine(15) transglycosylase TgtA [Candidatus Heimdallarchaeota archaeon]
MAKIGKVEVNNKSFTTPALFPVVDPFQQSFEISRLKSEFGFDQVITSSYLMSKRFSTELDGKWVPPKLSDLPKIETYLNFDGVIMMDSGAYQVLLYGDIELGVTETLDLQKAVGADFGVIMDHPIGYNLSHSEAQIRIETTLKNLNTSIDHFGESSVNWTLPIQGGKYIDLMGQYLDKVITPEVLDHFSLFALGSVVPVMINQDYSTLVKMIATARSKLPVTYPLHLFGAGHPAMFALSVFLGCDTFDSAAYALMAKDGRYLTVDGTLQLDNIDEFPCSCKVCSSYSVRELKEQPKHEQIRLLSEHNLWESMAEIKRIRLAIRMGRLWDLVQQRASSVPRLGRATRMAVDFVTTGNLSKLYQQGTPVSSGFAPKITRSVDLKKYNYRKIREISHNYILSNSASHIIVICYPMIESIFNKLDDKQMKDTLSSQSDYQILLMLPSIGIIPVGLNEMFPVAQLIHDLDMNKFSFTKELDLLLKLSVSCSRMDVILADDWPESLILKLNNLSPKIRLHKDEKPLAAIRKIVAEMA